MTPERIAEMLRWRSREVPNASIAMNPARSGMECDKRYCEEPAAADVYLGTGRGADYRVHVVLNLCEAHAGGLAPALGPAATEPDTMALALGLP